MNKVASENAKFNFLSCFLSSSVPSPICHFLILYKNLIPGRDTGFHTNPNFRKFVIFWRD